MDEQRANEREMQILDSKFYRAQVYSKQRSSNTWSPYNFGKFDIEVFRKKEKGITCFSACPRCITFP